MRHRVCRTTVSCDTQQTYVSGLAYHTPVSQSASQPVADCETRLVICHRCIRLLTPALTIDPATSGEGVRRAPRRKHQCMRVQPGGACFNRDPRREMAPQQGPKENASVNSRGKDRACFVDAALA